jgi:gliding motility-associated-like protein
VLLVAENDNGCIDTQHVKIFVVPEYYFYIPNAFTPNNNGVNEKFGVSAPQWARRFTMRIFNRFGQMVFETREATEHWDGTFKGSQVEEEVYVYTVEFLDMYGYWHIFKGSVLVMR